MSAAEYHRKMAETLKIGIPADPRIPLTDAQRISLMLAVAHEQEARRAEK